MIRDAIKRFFEPKQQQPRADDGPCKLCDDTGWAPCRCGGAICVCENHGERRCPNGCEER